MEMAGKVYGAEGICPKCWENEGRDARGVMIW